MDLEATVSDAVERIAQLSERSFLTRSPLHLAICGGCGGPSFQQPCPLCSFYPRGADKGSWHPARASREFFCEKVAASAPDGAGNLATWVLAQATRTVAYREMSGFRRAADEALAQAAELVVPAAGLVFDLVSTMEIPIHRERPAHDAWSFWEVVDAVRRQPSTESRRMAIVDAVGDLHAGSFDEACLRIREVVRNALLEEPRPSWELRRAQETLDRIASDEDASARPSPTA